MPHGAAVAMEGVSIAFPLTAGGRYDAVSSLTLTLGPGEFLAIIGPTGCGKSTVLNVAAGLLAPVAGSVMVFGRPLMGINSRAGYLFQQDTLMPWKTAIENVAVGLEVAGVPRHLAREQSHDWLKRVGLGAFADRWPHMLSGGQRKRVSLAQMLIRDPEILLMDEPFGPLDAQSRLIMGELLLDLWSTNRKAVMFVTHDLDEAIGLADRVITLSAGPAARIIGEFDVPIKRPRDLAAMRDDETFVQLRRNIWQTLRDEVIKGYERKEGIVS